ncbi:MAG: Ig-like domain-containing protein [Chitinophagales bacterium]|nr:Ig-like domain-containing protein [Chitinophagales bacterium]
MPQTGKLQRLVYVLLAGILLYGCATESMPLGGPEDKEPPAVKTASPPDKSVRFNADKIVITFNEFIQPSGFAQTIISPPVGEKPDIKQNRKNLTVKLKGELQPNTTYTINFGDDVKDLNQGNVLQNFTYVLSTGDYIDSQQLSGKVTMATDGNQAEGIIVALYPVDSIDGILKSKPLYFSKTNASGIYSIKNIKADRYRLFAVKDQNYNYLYDQPNELIGFAYEPVDLTDSFPVIKDLVVFSEGKKKLSLQGVKSLEPGKLMIAYSAPYKSLKFSGNIFDEDFIRWDYPTTDTAIVWFPKLEEKRAEIFLVVNDTLFDTARIELKTISRDSLLNNPKHALSFVNQSVVGRDVGGINEKSDLQTLYGSLKINLNRPITEINEAKPLQIIDSATQETIKCEWKLDEQTKQSIELNFERKEKTVYLLTILDSALRDVFGTWNKPLSKKIRTDAKDNYGNILLKITAENINKNYIVNLLNAKEEAVKTIMVHGASQKQESIQNIPAGSYRIKVIEDTNGNGKWDTGNFNEQRQPEKIIHFRDNYVLKGGWDLEVEVKF